MERTEAPERNLYGVILMISIPAIYILYCIFTQTVDRIGEEIGLAYTADAPLYWTVGRGMLKGAKPYVDLYETKPPGIFLLSALSFAAAGNAILTNIICFICLVITGIAPVAGVIIHCKNNNRILSGILLYIGSIVLGVMVMLYSQSRSGAAQVESIGAAFAIIYIMIISTIDGKSTELRSPKIWISSLFLMFSVMMKEPFLLVCIASALLFIQTKMDMLKKLILPGLSGGIAGILLQLATGTLIPYIKYYLPNMMGGHISRYGSPWKRGMDFKIILGDLSHFSSGLMIAIIFLIAIVFLSTVFNHTGGTSVSKKIINIIKPYLICYMTIFTVGLGGQYYNHHFVFAVPLYVSMFLYTTIYFNNIKLGKAIDLFKIDGVIFCICITCSTGIMLLPEYNYDNGQVMNNLKTMQKNADYVDSILESTGKSTYQYFGFNGNEFYCFTEHLPQGPIFFQDPYSFSDLDNWFSRSLTEQLNKVDIIIIQELSADMMNGYVYNYISQNFTHEPPDEVENIVRPESFQYYDVFYRK